MINRTYLIKDMTSQLLYVYVVSWEAIISKALPVVYLAYTGIYKGRSFGA